MTGGGFVALGFLKIFRTFEFISRGTGASSSLNATIAALAPSIGSLLVTGHSLGAALSSLTALALAVTNPGGVKGKITSFTFASPRVGLLDFASSFHCNINKSFRVWNVLDIVPEFPTFPFIHVGGHGDALVQTAGQLETLRLTPPCEHHLTSYQWLLDADNFNLNAECDRSLEAGLESVGEDGASVGAEAMARAMGGRG